jgi:hypothetical protein
MTETPTGGFKHFWYQLRDDQGVPRQNEQVYIYESVIDGVHYPYPAATELNIYDEDNNPLTQPLTTSTQLTSAASAATSAGAFDFYVRDAMWPSGGYNWSDKIRIQWDHDGTDRYADRIPLWGDYYEVDETDTDTDINKAISNLLACIMNTHMNLNAAENLLSSSSSSSSISSSSSSISSSSSST